MRVLDVGIIGAGTAGCAAAALLRRAGHEVTVYERVAHPGPVGAGIVLQPSGMAALARLGLLDEVVARGAPLARLRCRTASGRTVVELPYRLAGDDLFGLGLHRGVLFEALFRAARASGARLLLSTQPVDVRPAGGDRLALVDGAGARLGAHDLVVVADGARSQLRDDTDGEIDKRIRPYAWGALWFVGHGEGLAGELHQVVEGAGKMIGLLPTGLGPRGDRPLVSLYYSIRADRVDEWRRLGRGVWTSEVRALLPAAAPLLDQIGSLDEVLFTNYHDVEMARWHTRNLVYLGDAAHAMSPQLGQGANLALVDAVTLADALARPRPLPDALAAYSQARRRQLGFYTWATRWLTPFFQGDSPALGLFRDLAMPLAARLPWIRRQMVLSMCGLKTGLFTAASPPALPAAGAEGRAQRLPAATSVG